MIKSFRHKGLEKFFHSGNKKGVFAKHAQRLADILDQLDAAHQIQDMNFPGAFLHPLKGKLAGRWAINVSGNWRIVFKFEKGNTFEVDYIDYH